MNRMTITVELSDEADFPVSFIPQFLDCVKEVILTYDIGTDPVQDINLFIETKKLYRKVCD